jgi:hypothetical protein
MILKWDSIGNLENSLYDFLNTAIQAGPVQVLDDNGVAKNLQVRVGDKFDTDWGLPVIQIYHDSNPSAPRLSVGSNMRDTRYLIVIDIRANNHTNRQNIADWVVDTINEGFPYYEYTPNGENPTKTLMGNLGFDFVTNQKVNLGEDVSIYDKYRHRITISCWIPCS